MEYGRERRTQLPHASLPVPQLRLVPQVTLAIKLDSFPPQQLKLLARLLALARTRRTLGLATRPFAAEPADVKRRGDDAVAWDVGRKRVRAEGGTNCEGGA